MHLSKYVVQHMADRNAGRILFTSSIAAEMPAPFEAVYGASKAFLLSFAQALRNELKDTNVTVTAEMHRKLSEPGSAPKVKGHEQEANP